MNEQRKYHATIALERSYGAPPARIFDEFANPVARARWSTPSGDELIYDEAAFEAGGRDVFRCGPKGNLKFRGETRYHLIVPSRCVISSETVEMDGQHLAVSLNTLELEEVAGGTKLKLTVQIVSSAGEGMIKGFEDGNKAALDGLAAHLAVIG